MAAKDGALLALGKGVQGMLGTDFGASKKLLSGANVAGVAGGLLGAGIGIAGANMISEGARGENGRGIGSVVGGAAMLGASYGGLLGVGALSKHFLRGKHSGMNNLIQQGIGAATSTGAIAAGTVGVLSGAGLMFDGATGRNHRGLGSVLGGSLMLGGAAAGIGIMGASTGSKAKRFNDLATAKFGNSGKIQNHFGHMFGNGHIVSANNDIRRKIGNWGTSLVAPGTP